MRPIFAAKAGCSTGRTLLHELHQVFGATLLEWFFMREHSAAAIVVVQRHRDELVLQECNRRPGQHRPHSPGCQRTRRPRADAILDRQMW